MRNFPFVPFAEGTRGGQTESIHYGVAVAADAAGGLVAAWGDPDFVTYPRSALKPFQALDLVESGAADAMGLEDRHLALACASHRGEAIHDALIRSWLKALSVGEDALACGPDYPRHEPTAHGHIRAGRPKSRIWHNCSGKHCGFLTLARHIGADIAGYEKREHLCQQRYFDILSDFIGADARAQLWGIDGCTLPAPAISMAVMAAAVARFASGSAASSARKAAIERLLSAMRAHPQLVSGSGAINGALLEASAGRVIVKTGAEGFLIAMVPDLGLGIALKVADGASRPRNAVLIEILRQLGVLDGDAARAVSTLMVAPILDSVARPVGELRVRLPAAKG